MMHNFFPSSHKTKSSAFKKILMTSTILCGAIGWSSGYAAYTVSTLAGGGTAIVSTTPVDGKTLTLSLAGTLTGSQNTTKRLSGIVVDASNTIYVTSLNGIIKITPNGLTSIHAGSVTAGAADNAVATTATFNMPAGISLNTGALTIVDSKNNCIRKMSDGGITRIAGICGTATGYVEGAATTAAKFNSPDSIFMENNGTTYISDFVNYRIRKIQNGTVSTYAGSGSRDISNNTTATAAKFKSPSGIVMDSSRNLYVADTDGHCIRKIATPNATGIAGAVSTLAGVCNTAGSVNATGTSAKFNSPIGLATDNTYLYVADTASHCIRAIKLSDASVTTIAGVCGTAGTTDGALGTAKFYSPTGITLDSAGNIYVVDSDSNSQRIRKLTKS